jgi:hypothetical protein
MRTILLTNNNMLSLTPRKQHRLDVIGYALKSAILTLDYCIDVAKNEQGKENHIEIECELINLRGNQAILKNMQEYFLKQLP